MAGGFTGSPSTLAGEFTAASTDAVAGGFASDVDASTRSAIDGAADVSTDCSGVAGSSGAAGERGADAGDSTGRVAAGGVCAPAGGCGMGGVWTGPGVDETDASLVGRSG
ncbi:hypothetical protein [Micromonospora avicenniae]|uniref:hypothetical protein n=1 Tax=Micromonospora avicenniae TaxID=1198245 RepID=UPI003F5727F1